MHKRVSIIVPAYNEEKVLPRLFKSIAKQAYKNIETIVVDDSSTDSTFRLAKEFTKKAYSRSHQERSVQRNFGAKKAKGEYFLFLDADMKLSPNVVGECVRLLKNNKKAGAVTILEESVARTFWERVKAFERRFYNLDGDRVTDAARFFPRRVFEHVGGYDENITGPEDWDITDKVRNLGYEIETCRELIYHFERVPNPIKLAVKKYYYGLKSHRYLEQQKIPLLGPKTIYFLRPIFYKNWKDLVSHPFLTLGMVTMMTLELLGGGLGYLVGKYKNA